MIRLVAGEEERREERGGGRGRKCRHPSHQLPLRSRAVIGPFAIADDCLDTPLEHTQRLFDRVHEGVLEGVRVVHGQQRIGGIPTEMDREGPWELLLGAKEVKERAEPDVPLEWQSFVVKPHGVIAGR